MWVMYVDESGSPSDNTLQYFALSGVAVYERSIYGLSRTIDDIHNQYFDPADAIEFHASDIRSGRSFWRNVDKDIKEQIILKLGEAIGNPNFSRWVKLFGIAIQRAYLENNGPMIYERALSELCKRFDTFLWKETQRTQSEHYGMLIFDESRLQVETRQLMTSFRNHEHEWVKTGRIVEVPFFADSRDTRLLQAADYAAFGLFRRYEYGDASFLDRIIRAFHQDSEIIHGLMHLHDNFQNCYCAACLSRRVTKK